ncbi:MAG TPA: endonuclease III domain-containing protein, partial [Candidatus Hydrogenedens sp.]|nr:endonuclease III domain-containing protein [Candidatus Hydrogenedens sp.]
MEIYNTLSVFYGPTGWWPGDTPFEIAIGAI